MHGLNINLRSFQLSNSLYDQKDKIRVSITTLPEKNKQAFVVPANKIFSAQHIFTVNITDQTKEILFVFRKKSFINGDPIIAGTTIYRSQFPKSKNDGINNQMKSYAIYEHIAQSNKYSAMNLTIVGQMELQLSLCEAFEAKDYQMPSSIKIKRNGKDYTKMNNFVNDEDQYQQNNMIFDYN